MGVHFAEAAQTGNTALHVWEATGGTLVSKFVVALSFAIAVLLLPLDTAVMVSIVWGLVLIGFLGPALADAQGVAAWKVIGEHVMITLIVILATYTIGKWIGDGVAGLASRQ